MMSASWSIESLNALLDVADDGRARLDRRVYTDAALFEREMQQIWERGWVYLAHESQVPHAHDFLTTQLGRQPIVLIRDTDNTVRAFINACSHRGALVYRTIRGNARATSCPYHGWTFGSNGSLLAVTGEEAGAYPDSFKKVNLGLVPVARLESYRGLLFGSLNPDVISLREHLGDAAAYVDLLLDQSESGWEVVKGQSDYTYRGNWKLQMENGVDSYHAPFVHANFSSTIANRKRTQRGGAVVKAMNVAHDREAMQGGYFDFGRGHVTIWRDWDNPEDRFNYSLRQELEQRMGATRAHWAIGRLRNLLIFPNLLLMDQMSTQIRVIQPLAPDSTRVTGFAFAPVGEPAELRRQRLRFYEDFFNPSGMATPDDLEVFNLTQQALRGEKARWSDLSRGACHQVQGASPAAKELGIRPLSSGGWIEDEGIYLGIYRAWLAYLTQEANHA